MLRGFLFAALLLSLGWVPAGGHADTLGAKGGAGVERVAYDGSACTLTAEPVVWVAGAGQALDQCTATSVRQSTRALDSGLQLVQQRCCKICKKGKACGNSCINRGYTCHQLPGCACDG